MIGNLSKSIVKLPNFFLKTLDENYDIENEKTENNLIFQNNNYNRHSNIFREKDYLRFAPLVENLNFNRNRRHILFSKLNSNRKKIDFNDIVKSEEVYTSNLTSSNNNNNNININNNDNNKTNSELFKNNNDLTQTVKTEKFNYESKLIPIQQDEIDNFNNTVRTNIDNLINKIKNDSKRTSFRNSKISINENNNNNENNENNENNNENIENKNETFNNNSFPKNTFLPFNTKSYDSLFKEMLDQKISSLKLITPKQKKEIFSRNSNFESKSTFDRYKHFYDNYDYNNY